MSVLLPEKIGEFADPQSPEAYFFFPAALEQHILDPGTLDPNDPHTAALAVRNARIPDQAGVVALSSAELAAYDLVSARLDGNNLAIGPSVKRAVEQVSRRVVDDGLIALSFTNGLVKIVAEVTDSRHAAWDNSYRVIGGRAFKFLGLEAPTYEIEDIKPEETMLMPPRRYY